jgi:hypothetical protein
MSDWRVRLGIWLGLVAAAAFVAVERPSPDPSHGPVLSDCDGAMTELVIQYVSEAADVAAVPYRQFLGALPDDVTVHVVCPDGDAFDDLRRRVGSTDCRLDPVLTEHPQTCWSRDRWLAFAPNDKGGPTVLLHPREEMAAAIWPQRRGDAQIAGDLAAALDGVASIESPLAFDGGDFVADSCTAFVTPAVAERNLGGAARSLDDLRRHLAETLRRRVVLLDEAPPHHAGMFMMLVGNGSALVGDPSLAWPLVDDMCPLDDPDTSDATQQRFDAVAARCAAEGYRVLRIPVVPGCDGRTYLSYVNVILDVRGGTRTVYMPVYRGADTLNRAAAAVWDTLGYSVRPVDCSSTFRHFGSLRCLVHVLRRRST